MLEKNQIKTTIKKNVMEPVRYVTVKQEQPQKLFTNHFSLITQT